ncbi:MAG: hypothetical protein FWG67_04095 [Defluviitaleaceae bacterium]|nr:hypothetical protein [Defluviitaleaceae bacterium]
MNDYKKYFYSKSTVLILFLLTSISLISFLFSLNDKEMWISMLSDVSVDLNQESLMALIADYTAPRFVFDFWFNSGLFSISLMLLYAWSGAFLSAQLQTEKENGFGNLLMMRMNYKTRLSHLLISQSLYIATIVSSSIVISFILAFALGGVPTTYTRLGDGHLLSFPQVLLVALIQAIWISLWVILVNGISMLCNALVKNKYVVQALPALLFIFTPYLLGTVIGNLFPLVGRVLIYFIPDTLVTVINMAFNDGSIHFILWSISPIFILILIFVGMYKINVKKYMSDFL